MNTKIFFKFIQSVIVSLFLLVLITATPQSLYAYDHGYVDINTNAGNPDSIRIRLHAKDRNGNLLKVNDFRVTVSVLGGTVVIDKSFSNFDSWTSNPDVDKLLAGTTYIITTNSRRDSDQPRVHTRQQFTIPGGTTRRDINYSVLHTNNRTLYYQDNSPANNQMLDTATITRKFYARPESGGDIDYIETSNIEYSTSGSGPYAFAMAGKPYGGDGVPYDAIVAGDESVTLPQITIPNAKDGFYRWRVEHYLDQETPVVSLLPAFQSRYWSGESDYARFRLQTDISAIDEPITLSPSEYNWIVFDDEPQITVTGWVYNDSDNVTARQNETRFRLDRNTRRGDGYTIVLGRPIADEVPPQDKRSVSLDMIANPGRGIHKIEFCINRDDVVLDKSTGDDCLEKTFRVIPRPEPRGPLSCESPKVSAVLTIDRSQSMGGDAKPGITRNRLSYAKQATKTFINEMSVNDSNEYAIVRFARDGQWRPANWTTSEPAARSAVDDVGIASNPGTCIQCAINSAIEAMKALPDPVADERRIVILATDGNANWIESGQADSPRQAKRKAVQSAVKLQSDFGANIVSISVGNPDDISIPFMQHLAAATAGEYDHADDFTELEILYEKLAGNLTGASIAGKVFQDDSPKDSVLNPGELPLIRWTIKRTDLTTGDVKTDISKAPNGSYKFGALCAGHTYRIEEVLPSGMWERTLPAPPGYPGYYYDIPIASKDDHPNDKHFGNYPRGRSLSGEVFVDDNSNGVKDSNENTYNGSITITVSPFDAPATYPDPGNGKYLYDKTLDEKEYYVTYSGIPPGGFLATFPNPPTYKIKLGLGCGVISPPPPLGAAPTCDLQGNMTGLNFGITDLHAWYQAYGLNARLDQGVTNLIPVAPSLQCGGGYMMTNKPFNSAKDGPGILFTGDNSADFGKGKVSLTGRIAGKYGGSPFGEKYAPPSGRLRTSYAMILSTIQQRGIQINDLLSACGGDYNNCQLKNVLPEGVYKAEGNVTINRMEHFPPGQQKKITFLINGKLTINATTEVPLGSVHIFVAKDNIHVTKIIGQESAACPSTTSLRGLFITDKSFVVEGNNNCISGPADKMLNVAGAVVINAGLQGGSLEIQRTLCGKNATIPTFIVQPRLDMILNLPDYLKTSNFIWREVAP